MTLILSSRSTEFFHILITALHETLVDVLDPKIVGSNESETYHNQDDIRHFSREKGGQCHIYHEREEECKAGYNSLNPVTALVALHQVGIEWEATSIVHRQLQQHEEDEAHHEYQIGNGRQQG